MKKHFVVIFLSLVIALLTLIIWGSSSNARVLSGSFTDYGSPTTDSGSITALTLGEKGLVYGVNCGTHLFAFDPTANTLKDKGRTPGDCPLALTWGFDNVLFGGGWQSTLWAYNPQTEIFTIRGKVPGGRRIIGLATGLDGTIYIGTEPEEDESQAGRLFSFNPDYDFFIDLGGITGAVSVGYGLFSDSIGRIYGGTIRNGHVFTYDPVTNILADKGQPIASASGVTSLVEGGDGRIYGQVNGHMFSYDPVTDQFSDMGFPVAGQSRITSLTAEGNIIYGGTGSYFSDRKLPHLFSYDIETQSYTDLGIPVDGKGQWKVDSLVIAGMKVYGGTGSDGHFFSFVPNPEKVFLPLTTYTISRFAGPNEREPNDTPHQANGAIYSGKSYRGAFIDEADLADYFFFYMYEENKVHISLNQIPQGQDYDLYLYDRDARELSHSNESGKKDESIVKDLTEGLYYILVHNPFGEQHPDRYELGVTFE